MTDFKSDVFSCISCLCPVPLYDAWFAVLSADVDALPAAVVSVPVTSQCFRHVWLFHVEKLDCRFRALLTFHHRKENQPLLRMRLLLPSWLRPASTT